MEELLDKLNNLCQDLQDEFEINCGGCCFVAAVIAQNFENYNIPYHAMMLDDWDGYDFDDFFYGVDNRISNGIGLGGDVCAHYYLNVNGIDVNPDNPCDYAEVGLPEIVNSEDLFWIYETGEWNPTFDSDCCDHIADVITQFFDENFSKRRTHGRSI